MAICYNFLALTGRHSPAWSSTEELLGAAARTNDDRCVQGWIRSRQHASGFKSRTNFCTPLPSCMHAGLSEWILRLR